MTKSKRKRPESLDRPRESWIERRLREATEGGDVMRLEGAGRPLRGVDAPYDPDWWLKRKIEEEKLEVTPPALQISRKIAAVLKRLPELPSEAAVRRTVEDLIREVARANASVTSGPPTSVSRVDVEKAVARWRKKRQM